MKTTNENTNHNERRNTSDDFRRKNRHSRIAIEIQECGCATDIKKEIKKELKNEVARQFQWRPWTNFNAFCARIVTKSKIARCKQLICTSVENETKRNDSWLACERVCEWAVRYLSHSIRHQLHLSTFKHAKARMINSLSSRRCQVHLRLASSGRITIIKMKLCKMISRNYEYLLLSQLLWESETVVWLF